jgi:transcriptional regulator with XRE-family HTH domain
MLSNKELGSRIGVSQSMASRIRNGRRRPGVRTIERIHREFDIPLAVLLEAHRAGAPAFGALLTEYLGRDLQVAPVAA